MISQPRSVQSSRWDEVIFLMIVDFTDSGGVSAKAVTETERRVLGSLMLGRLLINLSDPEVSIGIPLFS